MDLQKSVAGFALLGMRFATALRVFAEWGPRQCQRKKNNPFTGGKN